MKKLILVLSAMVLATQVQAAGSSSMHSDAKDAKSNQAMGAATNATMGAMFMSQCTPKTWYMCVMGAMSLAQSVATAAASKQSGNTEAATYNGASVYSAYNDTATDGTLPAFVGQDLKKLEDMGYKVDDKKGTVSIPGKGDVPLSSFSSPGGMSGLGMSTGEIAAVQKVMKDATDKVKFSISGMGTSDAGGGGGGSSSYGSESGDDLSAYLASLRRKLNRRDPASIAGYTRMVAGEAVGVKADNIFEMVHRRYQQKRQGSEFIGD